MSKSFSKKFLVAVEMLQIFFPIQQQQSGMAASGGFVE